MVYGWDQSCERDPDWAAAVQADPDQPFYHVLPDEGKPDAAISQSTCTSRALPLCSPTFIRRAESSWHACSPCQQKA